MLQKWILGKAKQLYRAKKYLEEVELGEPKKELPEIKDESPEDLIKQKITVIMKENESNIND